MRQKQYVVGKCWITQNMSRKHVCYWTDPQAFKLACQEIEAKLFLTSKELSHVCKELRKNHEIVKLKDAVNDNPNQRCQDYFLPAMGMTLTELAMYDALAEQHKS